VLWKYFEVQPKDSKKDRLPIFLSSFIVDTWKPLFQPMWPQMEEGSQIYPELPVHEDIEDFKVFQLSQPALISLIKIQVAWHIKKP
jgi:hypothetical protein